MGHRGPKPAGLVVTVVKLPDTMRTALLAAATKRKRTKREWNLSDEIRHRLQHSLDDPDDYDERTRALMRLLMSTFRSMGLMKTTAKAHWTDDAHAFDQVVIAITTVLAAIRPPVPTEAPAEGPIYQGAFNARETLRDVQRAPAIAPANASRHRQEMAHLRQLIGDVVDRAIVYGKTAEEIRDSKRERSELAALRLKESKAALKHPLGPPLTNVEERRLKELLKRLPIAFTIEDVVVVTRDKPEE